LTILNIILLLNRRWGGEKEYFTKPKNAVKIYLNLKARLCHVLLVKDGRGGLSKLRHDLWPSAHRTGFQLVNNSCSSPHVHTRKYELFDVNSEVPQYKHAMTTTKSSVPIYVYQHQLPIPPYSMYLYPYRMPDVCTAYCIKKMKIDNVMLHASSHMHR
jgi:hypothetical protein